MISYRTGAVEDQSTIIHLHALSWKRHYRGILSDHYLDEDVENDRYRVWHARLQREDPTQHIILAEDQVQACGFACTFLNHDPTFGALLDNLHVLSEYQGLGIGAQLIIRSAQWVYENDPHSKFYLWVFRENELAKSFYRKMGAQLDEIQMIENPDGGSAEIVRCVWHDLAGLANR